MCSLGSDPREEGQAFGEQDWGEVWKGLLTQRQALAEVA